MDENQEDRVRRVLEAAQFQVAPIPTDPTEQRADFRVSDERDAYIVEVKTKEDDPGAVKHFTESLYREGEATDKIPMGRTNRMSAIFREAARQIRATPSSSTDFRLIWLTAIGRHEELQTKQFEDTVYGRVQIIQETGRAIPCYFYAFNEFSEAKDIDGAVVGTEAEARLCINPCSSRLNEFRKTKLYQFFKDYRAALDPLVLEQEGKAFIADCDVDRRDGPAVLRYLRKKYAIDFLIPFQGMTHIAEVVVAYP